MGVSAVCSSLLSQVYSALSRSTAHRGALGPRTYLETCPTACWEGLRGPEGPAGGGGGKLREIQPGGWRAPGPRSPLPPGVQPRPPSPGPRRPHALRAHAHHGGGGTRRPSAHGDSRAGEDTAGTGPRQRQALHQLPPEPAGDEGKAHPLLPRPKTLLLQPARGGGRGTAWKVPDK